jgi:Domain of unknown function (DUF3425)
MTTATSLQPNHIVRSDDDGGMSAPKASEKRRAQNRAAQKTYREKRKKRLQELEQLAVSAGLLSKSTPSSSASASESPPDIDRLMDLPVTSTVELSDKTLPEVSLESTSLFQSDDLFPQSLSLDPPSTEPWQSSKIAPTLEAEWATLSNGLSSFADFPDHHPFADNLDIVRNISESDSNNSNDSNAYQISKSTRRSLYKDTRNSFTVSGYYPIVKLKHADPLANTLRLHQTTLCWAFYQNVLHIGLDESICADNSSSPFYRPEAAGESDVLIQSVQNTFSCLKRDLRPTKEQITTPHPGYIDVLPFPEVRSRIIELLANDPPLFDEDEFWHDIENDALMCWGSISLRPGNHSSPGGAPWDARSWEAKTWFLAKWSFVVGGEDGELSRSSSWWREMRGVSQGFSF